MKLYYAPGACSLSPHIVAREADIPVELERVDLATRRTASGEDYLAVNPNGYVPAIRLTDGSVLTEGVAIVQYLADQKPEAGLIPTADSLARARVLEQLTFISAELHKTFGPFFTPGAAETEKAGAMNKIGWRLDYVERVLADGRPYFSGERFSVSDAYLFTVVNWTRLIRIDLTRWPKLAAFLGRVAARPRVQEALKAEGLA